MNKIGNIYTLVNSQKLDLNYSFNNKFDLNKIKSNDTNNLPVRKPQYGESKYTSSLYVGKMHKLLRYQN